MNFNPITSKSIQGIVTAALAILLSPAVFAVLPAKVSAVITAIAGIWSALGFRDAIASNGVGSSPSVADTANGVKS